MGSDVVKEKLDDFLKASSEVQSVVPEGVHVHCFLTCPVSNNDPNSEGLSLYPLVPRLLHVALHTARRGSNVVGQSCRDTFLIAYPVARGRFHTETEQERCRSIRMLVLSSWFTNTDSPEESLLPPPNCIVCDRAIMEKLLTCE